MATKIKQPKRYYKTTSGTYRARLTRNGNLTSKNFMTATAAKNWLKEQLEESVGRR
jgi:hypothetical protein